MDHNKFYKVKATGEYLGRFCFANEHYPDGIDRPRAGTLMYFMPNNWKEWNYLNGTMRKYTTFFNEDHPDIPDDIEETEEKQ
jgi:hypothetical protein